MEKIKVLDKCFIKSIDRLELAKAVSKVAKNINHDYHGKSPLFLCVLNGSFMFASDLMKEIDLACEISFIKLSSYQGTSSTGQVRTIMGFNENIEGRDIIVLEDIVDTGHTITRLFQNLYEMKPASVKIATMLFKPAALQVDLKPDYVGIVIPNEFILGYGLDYDGFGRNLADIYKITEE